jgi:hypothetical protein
MTIFSRDICLKLGENLLDLSDYFCIIWVSQGVFQHAESISTFRNELWTTKINDSYKFILPDSWKKKSHFTEYPDNA